VLEVIKVGLAVLIRTLAPLSTAKVLAEIVVVAAAVVVAIVKVDEGPTVTVEEAVITVAVEPSTVTAELELMVSEEPVRDNCLRARVEPDFTITFAFPVTMSWKLEATGAVP